MAAYHRASPEVSAACLYDGGGMACGPVSGSMIVEVCVTDKEGHNFFVVVSQMDNLPYPKRMPLRSSSNLM